MSMLASCAAAVKCCAESLADSAPVAADFDLSHVVQHLPSRRARRRSRSDRPHRLLALPAALAERKSHRTRLRFATRASRSTSRPPQRPPPRSRESTIGPCANACAHLDRELRRPTSPSVPRAVPSNFHKARGGSIRRRICFDELAQAAVANFTPPADYASTRCRHAIAPLAGRPDLRLADRRRRQLSLWPAESASSPGRFPPSKCSIGTWPSA